MKTYQSNIEECNAAAEKLYYILSSIPTITSEVELFGGGNTIILQFFGVKHRIRSLRISFPVRKNRNGPASIIEIRLLDFRSKMLKDKHFGYDNARYFNESNLVGIVDEIVSISDYRAYPFMRELNNLLA